MKIVPALNGVQWLRIGWLLFMRNPLMWILAFSAVWLMTAVVLQIPYLGLLMVALALPAFSVGFMTMGAAAEAGRAIEPILLFAGFRGRLQPLISLGGIYFIGVCIFLLLLQWTAGDALGPTAVAPPSETLRWDDVALPLLFYILMNFAFWFSPALSAWHAMPPMKALFFSFFACLRNWRAFAVYALTLTVFVTGGFLLSTLVMRMVLGADVPPESSMQNFMSAFLLGLMPMLLASVYASYRDIFGAPPQQSP